MEKLLKLDELAEKLGVEKSWVYSKTRTNEIPHRKLGKYCRFDEKEILEWLNSHKQGA
jgi:excisionase family DNA binding protein